MCYLIRVFPFKTFLGVQHFCYFSLFSTAYGHRYAIHFRQVVMVAIFSIPLFILFTLKPNNFTSCVKIFETRCEFHQSVDQHTPKILSKFSFCIHLITLQFYIFILQSSALKISTNNLAQSLVKIIQTYPISLLELFCFLFK